MAQHLNTTINVSNTTGVSLNSGNDPRFPIKFFVSGNFTGGFIQFSTLSTLGANSAAQIFEGDNVILYPAMNGNPAVQGAFEVRGNNGVVIDAWTVDGDGTFNTQSYTRNISLSGLPWQVYARIHNPDGIPHDYILTDSNGNLVGGPYTVQGGETKVVGVSSTTDIGTIYVTQVQKVFPPEGGPPSYQTVSPPSAVGPVSQSPSTNNVSGTPNSMGGDGPIYIPPATNFFSYPTNTTTTGQSNNFVLSAIYDELGKIRYDANLQASNAANQRFSMGQGISSNTAQLVLANGKLGTISGLLTNVVDGQKIVITNTGVATNLLSMIASNTARLTTNSFGGTVTNQITNAVSVVITNDQLFLGNLLTNEIGASNLLASINRNLTNGIGITNAVTNSLDFGQVASNQVVQIGQLSNVVALLSATNAQQTNAFTTNDYTVILADTNKHGWAAATSNGIRGLGQAFVKPGSPGDPGGTYTLAVGTHTLDLDLANHAKLGPLAAKMKTIFLWLLTVAYIWAIVGLHRLTYDNIMSQQQSRMANMEFLGFNQLAIAPWLIIALFIPTIIASVIVILGSFLADNAAALSIFGTHPLSYMLGDVAGNYAVHLMYVCFPVDTMWDYGFFYILTFFVLWSIEAGARVFIRSVPG